MTTLTLERRTQKDKSPVFADASGKNVGMMTPPIDEDYWSYRVMLSDTQAIVGFPKFGTIGIGFAVEDDDWNVNLPYSSETEQIFQHILDNKGDDSISDKDVREAIKLVQQAAREDRDS
jgi:hypothetical protein